MNFCAKQFSELAPMEVYEILRLRAKVFVEEQHICVCDPDGADVEARHFFAMEDGRLVAYLRMLQSDSELESVHIGRVVVAPDCRARHYGASLMHFALQEAQRMGKRTVVLHAQKPVEGFYAKLGFETISGDFMEAGIAHCKMRCNLACM